MKCQARTLFPGKRASEAVESAARRKAKRLSALAATSWPVASTSHSGKSSSITEGLLVRIHITVPER